MFVQSDDGDSNKKCVKEKKSRELSLQVLSFTLYSKSHIVFSNRETHGHSQLWRFQVASLNNKYEMFEEE